MTFGYIYTVKGRVDMVVKNFYSGQVMGSRFSLGLRLNGDQVSFADVLETKVEFLDDDCIKVADWDVQESGLEFQQTLELNEAHDLTFKPVIYVDNNERNNERPHGSLLRSLSLAKHQTCLVQFLSDGVIPTYRSVAKMVISSVDKEKFKVKTVKPKREKLITAATQVSNPRYTPIQATRPVVQSPYQTPHYAKSTSRTTYKIAIYTLELTENCGKIDMPFIRAQIVRSENSQRHVLSLNTAKTKIGMLASGAKGSSVIFLELLTLQLDNSDVERFGIDMRLCLDLYNFSDNDLQQRWLVPLPHIPTEKRLRVDTVAGEKSCGTLMISIEKQAAFSKYDNLDDDESSEVVDLKMTLDFPDTCEYFGYLRIVDDAHAFKQQIQVTGKPSTTDFHEKRCHFGRFGTLGHCSSARFPFSFPKSQGKFNILSALVIELVKIPPADCEERPLDPEVFGCHLLQPDSIEDPKHIIPLFDASGSPTGIVTLSIMRRNVESRGRVRPPSTKASTEYEFDLEPILPRQKDQGISAETGDHNILDQLRHDREKAVAMMKDLSVHDRHMQNSVVQLSARLASFQDEQIRLRDENNTLKRKILLAEDIANDADLESVPVRDLTNRLVCMRMENQNILDQLDQAKESLDDQEVRQRKTFNDQLASIKREHKQRLLKRNLDARRRQDLIKEQERLILELENECAKLRTRNHLLIRDTSQKITKEEHPYHSGEQLRIISGLKSRVDEYKHENKHLKRQNKEFTNRLEMELERSQAAETSLERSASRWAGERHRLLLKLRHEQLRANQRLLEYNDDIDF